MSDFDNLWEFRLPVKTTYPAWGVTQESAECYAGVLQVDRISEVKILLDIGLSKSLVKQNGIFL